MSFQSLQDVLQRLNASTEALAAIGAELKLRRTDTRGDSRVRDLLREIVEKIEPGLLDELTADQEAMALGYINAFFRQAFDLIDNPGRAPGWSFVDPAILQAYGQISRRAIHMIEDVAARLPDLAQTLREPGVFLDVGTGVGWMAIEAARTWPALRVVGIDTWETSLGLARENLANTGMEDRVELRLQALQEVPDRDAFAVVWLPGSFLPREIIPDALRTMRAALRPGGWLVFSLFAAPPNPLGRSLGALKIVRGGGHPWSDDEIERELRAAGFEEVRSVAPALQGQFTVGRRGG